MARPPTTSSFNHVQRVRRGEGGGGGIRNKLSVYVFPLLGGGSIKSNIMATCTSFADLSEGHAKIASKPATSLQSPDVVQSRFEYCTDTSCGDDANLDSATVAPTVRRQPRHVNRANVLHLGCGNAKKTKTVLWHSIPSPYRGSRPKTPSRAKSGDACVSRVLHARPKSER